jgi:hypothetical protein
MNNIFRNVGRVACNPLQALRDGQQVQAACHALRQLRNSRNYSAHDLPVQGINLRIPSNDPADCARAFRPWIAGLTLPPGAACALPDQAAGGELRYFSGTAVSHITPSEK